MNIFSAWGGRRSPYTHFAHSIPGRPRDVLRQASYQILPGGHGVPANIHEHSHAWGSHVIEFFAIGTAVEEISKDHVIERPSCCR